MGVWEGLEMKMKKKVAKTLLIGTGAPHLQITSGQSLFVRLWHAALARATEDNLCPSGSGAPRLSEHHNTLETPFFPIFPYEFLSDIPIIPS